MLIKHCFSSKEMLLEPRLGLINLILPSKSTVEKRFAKFRRGEMSTEDDTRSARPKEAVINKHKKNQQNNVGEIVKLIEIAEPLKISKERAGHIVHECLCRLKICLKWVSRTHNLPKTTTN